MTSRCRRTHRWPRPSGPHLHCGWGHNAPSSMDVFAVHPRLVADYDAFPSSLVEVRDQRIKEHLEEQRQRKVRWPDPYLSLNPGFKSGGPLKELVDARLLDEEGERLFRVKTGPEEPGPNATPPPR